MRAKMSDTHDGHPDAWELIAHVGTVNAASAEARAILAENEPESFAWFYPAWIGPAESGAALADALRAFIEDGVSCICECHGSTGPRPYTLCERCTRGEC